MVKIDRSFITGIDGDQHDRSLVGAIADLGHALGLTVLAEGVETDAQRHWLTRLGYDLAQGYFFARPAPLAEVDLTMATSAGRLEPA